MGAELIGVVTTLIIVVGLLGYWATGLLGSASYLGGATVLGSVSISTLPYRPPGDLNSIYLDRP
jgi:hypothetical protein